VAGGRRHTRCLSDWSSDVCSSDLVERLAERQAVERASIGTIDVIGVAVGPERAAVQVFPLRGGRMVDRYSFHLENAAGEEAGERSEERRVGKACGSSGWRGLGVRR